MSTLIVSWNIARDTDYLGLRYRTGTLPNSFDEFPSLTTKRKELIEEVLGNIVSLGVDLLCLQEVSNADGVEEVLGEDFEYEWAIADCLVAWKKSRYSLVSNSSISDPDEGRSQIVDLKDASINKVVRVASIHLHGFDLGMLEDPRRLRGDDQLTELINRLVNESPRDMVFVGVDANTTPVLHDRRFKWLADAGFQRDPDERPSAFNKVLDKAKLDHIFVRAGDGSTTQIATVPFEVPLEDPMTNPSDHRPICATISLNS